MLPYFYIDVVTILSYWYRHSTQKYLNTLTLKFTAIGISEIWLRDCICDLYDNEGYNFVEAHRPSKIGGGIEIVIRNDIPLQSRNDVNIYNDFFVQVFIEIDKEISNKYSKITIAVIYRPPGSEMKLFNDAFCELLNTMKQENNLIYLMGDYNINLLNYDIHNETNDVVDILCAPSFVSLINRPTWVQNEPALMIEYIFTNNHSKLNHPF